MIKRKTSSKTTIFAILTTVFIAMSGIILLNAGNCTNFGEHATATAMSSAEGMAVIEVKSGRVLYSKNMHKVLAPASTTKILTAIVVLENVDCLDTPHKIPDSAIGVEGSSIYLQKGEKLSVRDLLYGLMLQSGNDCAEALAIITAGSKEKFAVLMNETAKKAGAINSNFVTPHGLDAKGHMTTAYDLAKISAYAMHNKDFATIVATKKHSCPYGDREYNRVIVNKNRLLNSYDGADGVKTGYTKKAGRTFVGSATRNNMQVVCAVLNCGPMFEDTARLLNAAFNEFSLTELGKRGDTNSAFAVPVTDSKKDNALLTNKEVGLYPLRESELASIEIKANKPSTLKAPQKQGDIVGDVEYYLENQLIFKTDLVIIEDVESLSLVDRLKDIATNWNK